MRHLLANNFEFHSKLHHPSLISHPVDETEKVIKEWQIHVYSVIDLKVVVYYCLWKNGKALTHSCLETGPSEIRAHNIHAVSERKASEAKTPYGKSYHENE